MEIIAGIHKVDGVNCNCYIIIGKDHHELTLIDTGLPGSAGAILNYVRHLGMTPKDVKRIILTHGHPDHTGSLDALRKATGAKVAVHRVEADFISGKKPLPERDKSLISEVVQQMIKLAPIRPDILLDEGQEISGLLVFHVPGHTPGSIALLDRKRNAIFVGDAMWVVNKNSVEAPIQQFTWNPKLAIKSIRKIASLDFDILLGGHGEPLRPDASGKVRKLLMKLKGG